MFCMFDLSENIGRPTVKHDDIGRFCRITQAVLQLKSDGRFGLYPSDLSGWLSRIAFHLGSFCNESEAFLRLRSVVFAPHMDTVFFVLSPSANEDDARVEFSRLGSRLRRWLFADPLLLGYATLDMTLIPYEQGEGFLSDPPTFATFRDTFFARFRRLLTSRGYPSVESIERQLLSVYDANAALNIMFVLGEISFSPEGSNKEEEEEPTEENDEQGPPLPPEEGS